VIPTIEKIIKGIQSNFGFWESEMSKFFYKVNKKLDKIYPEQEEKTKAKSGQGKRKEKKKQHKIQYEPKIQELLNMFDSWTRLFNTLEQKSKHIIFHQKILQKELHNIESTRALYELLKELRMK
jgi:hypothetical protein